MNIAIGKFGKSVIFNSNSWGATGGDSDAPKYYENLFHKNPDKKFYLIGLNDFSRLPAKDQQRINKYNNVINPWKEAKEWKKSYQGNKNTANIEFISSWFKTNNIKIDVGILFGGPTSASNIPGKSRRMKDSSALAKPIMMLANYAGPMINLINETEWPYVLIVNDPRYFPFNARDLFRMPSAVLSQYNEVSNCKQRKQYDGEIIETPIEQKYTAVETIFLLGQSKDKKPIKNTNLDTFFEDVKSEDEKSIKFMIVCNEGSPSRYPQLKEAILDHVNDVEIYGKWKDEIINNDSRFKGPKKFNELQSMLSKVKYTFCIPIKKGWVTAKFWEMAHYGIIPFLHKTYDEQNNLKVPEFLRIENSKDLYDKIDFLEKNPEAYKILRKNIDNMLKEEYYNGEYLQKLTINTLKTL